MSKYKLPFLFSLQFWAYFVVIAGISASLLFGADSHTSISEHKNAIDILNSSMFKAFAVAAGCLIAVLITIFVIKFNNLSTDATQSELKVKTLSKELLEAIATNDTQQEYFDRLNSIYTSYFLTLDSLSAEYFDKNDAGPQVRMSIIKKLEDELMRTQSGEFDASLFEWVNYKYNNLLTILEIDVPKLKNQDLKLIALKLAGFSSKSISLILQISTGNYYNRITRLRAKISDSQSDQKQMLLNLLSQQHYRSGNIGVAPIISNGKPYK